MTHSDIFTLKATQEQLHSCFLRVLVLSNKHVRTTSAQTCVPHGKKETSTASVFETDHSLGCYRSSSFFFFFKVLLGDHVRIFNGCFWFYLRLSLCYYNQRYRHWKCEQQQQRSKRKKKRCVRACVCICAFCMEKCSACLSKQHMNQNKKDEKKKVHGNICMLH